MKITPLGKALAVIPLKKKIQNVLLTLNKEVFETTLDPRFFGAGYF